MTMDNIEYCSNVPILPIQYAGQHTMIVKNPEEDEEEDENPLVTIKRNPIDKIFTTRIDEGFFKILINGHLNSSKPKFREFFRINYDQFMFILLLIKNDITLPPSKRVKKPIKPEEKLAVTLRISHSYISLIIKKTLSAFNKYLTPIFLPDISTVDFNIKASEFMTKWNFPNCILVIDGKHIRIRSHNNTGSPFYNYKDYFSIVLLVMVDVNYKFIAVDIGSFGREGDSGIFLKSTMGDEAFRLHTHIMKPYTRQASRDDKTKSIFNYRLSRARRVIENEFGLLSQVFRVFYQPISIEPSTCDNLIIVACCLHNMLRDAYLKENGRAFIEFDSREPVLTNNIIPIARGGGFANAEGFDVREVFKEFFCNEGAVSWQENL
ncbi:hypothetical protein QTP88_029490 [Uroleucon formosanum]